jgi:hypothetical protein
MLFIKKTFWTACYKLLYGLFFNGSLLALTAERHRLSRVSAEESCYATEMFIIDLYVFG